MLLRPGLKLEPQTRLLTFAKEQVALILSATLTTAKTQLTLALWKATTLTGAGAEETKD